MNSNEKPRTLGAGLINDIDGESTYANSKAWVRLLQKSEYEFGKSAPSMTNRDKWNLFYLHDHKWNQSKRDAEAHLRANGFTPMWSHEDQVRALEFNRRESLVNLLGEIA